MVSRLRRIPSLALALCSALLGACGETSRSPEAQTSAAALPRLVVELKLKDPAARVRAAVAIGEMGPDAKDAVSALVATLKDRDVSVRAAAAYSLGQIGPEAKNALPELKSLTRQPGPLRDVAAKAVEQIDR